METQKNEFVIITDEVKRKERKKDLLKLYIHFELENIERKKKMIDAAAVTLIGLGWLAIAVLSRRNR